MTSHIEGSIVGVDCEQECKSCTDLAPTWAQAAPASRNVVERVLALRVDGGGEDCAAAGSAWVARATALVQFLHIVKQMN